MFFLSSFLPLRAFHRPVGQIMRKCWDIVKRYVFSQDQIVSLKSTCAHLYWPRRSYFTLDHFPAIRKRKKTNSYLYIHIWETYDIQRSIAMGGLVLKYWSWREIRLSQGLHRIHRQYGAWSRLVCVTALEAYPWHIGLRCTLNSRACVLFILSK